MNILIKYFFAFFAQIAQKTAFDDAPQLKGLHTLTRQRVASYRGLQEACLRVHGTCVQPRDEAVSLLEDWPLAAL